jgi:hypothetical protein
VQDEDIRVTVLVQGVAGAGGSSTDWASDPDHAQVAFELWSRKGYLAKVTGREGSTGQSVDDVADVHVYIVTRPRGQTLDTIHVRSW